MPSNSPSEVPSADQIRALQPGWRLHLEPQFFGWVYSRPDHPDEKWITIAPPPKGWSVERSIRYPDRYYYHHSETKVSLWEVPNNEEREKAKMASETTEEIRKRRERERMSKRVRLLTDEQVVKQWQEEQDVKHKEATREPPRPRRPVSIIEQHVASRPLGQRTSSEETRTLYRTPTGGCTYDAEEYREAMREYR